MSTISNRPRLTGGDQDGVDQSSFDAVNQENGFDPNSPASVPGTTSGVSSDAGFGVTTQTVSTPGSGLVFVNTYASGDTQQYINAAVAAEQALHVGDNLDEDVRGAAACGIPALLLCRDPDSASTAHPDPAHPVGPAADGVPTIGSLAELDWP